MFRGSQIYVAHGFNTALSGSQSSLRLCRRSLTLSRWIGVPQPTAWKMGHAIRQMMIPTPQGPSLTGTVELDEKYLGGKPRYQPGVAHKRGRGTSKQ